MKDDSLTILFDFDDVELNNLTVSDVKSLLPATSFQSIVEKLRKGDIELLVNADIPQEDFEKVSPFKTKLLYVVINRIPLVLLLLILASALLINPWNLLTLLIFPITRFTASLIFHFRHIAYSILTLTSFYYIISEPNLIITLNLCSFLFAFIWRHYRDQQKINVIINSSLDNESNFLKNFLSNKIILANTERIFNSPSVALEVLKRYLTEQPKELSLDDKLFFCKQCRNKAFDKQQGVVCGLTNMKPTFLSDCKDYTVDKGFEEREELKYIRRENWKNHALYSTNLSFILIDIVFLASAMSSLNFLLKGEIIPFLTSGSLYMFSNELSNATVIIYCILPLLLITIGILARLKLKEALLIAAIIIGIDTATLVFYKQFLLEPHIRMLIVLGIGAGYSNIENAKIYSKNLPSSNAFLRSYFKAEKNSGA